MTDRTSRLTSCLETTDLKPLQTLLAAFFFLVACSSLAVAQATPPDAERAVEVFTDDMVIDAESREAETQRQEEAELGRTRPSGPSYRVTSFQLRYLEELEGAPDLALLRSTVIRLEVLGDEYVGEGMGGRKVSFPLNQIPADGPTRFDATAIIAVDQQIVAALSEMGYGSMTVAPDPDEINFVTREDLRPANRSDLTITVWFPTIREMQTFSTGDRFPESESANNPAHARIVENSPVQAGDVFQPKLVEDYLHRLNRHPGRRVTSQISPSRDQRQLYLDYSVAETKPWLLYFRTSNDGTDSAGRYLLSAGFLTTQLTDRDDIFSLDYVGNTENNIHAVYTGYDFPVFREDLRLRVGAHYSDYVAALGELGTGILSVTNGYEAGASAIFKYSLWQWGALFLDGVLGAEYKYVNTRTEAFPFISLHGQDNFLLPQVGLDLNRRTDNLRFAFKVWSDFTTLDHDATPLTGGIGDLGRFEPSEEFYLLKWDLMLRGFLDPLVKPWFTGERGSLTRMAHEMYFSFRGQSAFDQYRLIPQYKYYVGGLSTVRGYRQSVLSGDSALVGRVEYRLHVPRLFRPNPEPKELPVLGDFAVAPRQYGGRPDWDLVIKAFYDVGKTWQSNIEADETDDFVQGVGLGMDLLLKRNLSATVDWGHSLNDARCFGTGNTSCLIEKGKNEVYFSINLMY